MPKKNEYISGKLLGYFAESCDAVTAAPAPTDAPTVLDLFNAL